MNHLSPFQLKPWQLKAIEKGFENAFSVGPVVGYSVVSCHFTVHSITVGRGTSDTMIASAIVGAVQVQCARKVVGRNYWCVRTYFM
jgi:translation elongation factor EF-G